MPYSISKPEDLPTNVKQMPKGKQKVWVNVFNSAYARCQQDGGADCEGSAMKQANGVTKESKRSLFQRFTDLFTTPPAVEVERLSTKKWSGAASNYATTDAYCNACLIDVNASGQDKVQALCKLPVKEAGGAVNVNAVHAAAAALAGGRGGLVKPTDVDAAKWDAAVKGAANKVISMYGQMKEDAPDSVYKVAGKSKPARALDMGRFYQRIHDALEEAMGGMGPHPEYAMPIDLYHEGEGMFLIVANEGRLYRLNIAVSPEDEITLSDPVEVTQVFNPINSAARSLTVLRDVAGKARWLMIADTAVLNRVGEIDSMELFDSFVDNAKERGYPYLTFYHMGEVLRMGQADLVARDEALYIATGTFDDTPLGQAAASGLEKQAGTWGASVKYEPLSAPELVEVVRDVRIPVYREGWNEEISVLPEESAAAWFTVALTGMEDVTMRREVKEALAKLVGEQLADQFEKQADETNRTIRENGLVVREGETVTPAETPTPEAEKPAETAAPVAAETTPPVAQAAVAPAETNETVEIDQEVIQNLVNALQASPAWQAFQLAVQNVNAALGSLQQQSVVTVRALDDIGERLDTLEESDEQKQQEWVSDLPKARHVRVTYRARAQKKEEGEDEAPNLAERASQTLSMFKNPRRS